MISTYNWYWYKWYFDLIYSSQEEGKYDKNEDRDRDYYRRRRPAGQGRVSSDLQSTGVINEKLSGDQLINLSPWTICIVLLVSLMTIAYYYCDDQAPGVWPSIVLLSCDNYPDFCSHETFQHSDEPPYDNWRRSDIYTDHGDSWDRSYKVLPGAEAEES